MKHHHRRLACVLIAISLAAGGSALGQEKGQRRPDAVDVMGLPVGILKEAAPLGPVSSPKVLRATVKKGDRVSVTGRIGGGAVPWVKDRAIFTIVGDELEACSDHGMDGCPQPWDYCCEQKSEIAQCSATIQILDAKSKLIKVGMKGKAGLVELSDVTVTGVVQMVDDKTFVIAAESLFVWPTMPIGWSVGHAPEESKSPSQVRTSGKVGDQVVLKGRIGGADDPIAAGLASFTVVGDEIEYRAGEAKPWAYETVSRESLASNICDVQFVDAQGDVLKIELDGRRNIAAGREIVVVGTIARNDAGALVIHATQALKP